MNADFKLKILRSESIFDTSEEALKYIEKYLEDNIAEGEPAVVYYGEDKEHPNVILCIGNGKEKNAVYTVDFQAIKDQLATVSEEEATTLEELATAVTKIEGILKAVDLSCDIINGEIVISYNPDPKDIVIGDAETIADALAKLSAYAQEVANTVQIEVADTNTIKLTKEDGVLSADVKFSELGDTSVAGVDDNIIGAFDDGIYAVAHLDYEDETKTITFTTSGYDDKGDFKRDANVTTIKLGEHTLYKADNEDHNLKVTVDNTEMTISADAKISDDSDNILTINDGKLYVKGRANNIIYKNSNVRDALDDLYKEVAEAGKNTEYIDTDTIKFTTKEDANGELNVSADVKLASNNSISIADGGLNVNLTIGVNATENTLIVKLGDVEKTYDLPDAKIIDHIEFKDGNLILWYDNDKSVTIPMEGLVAHYVFENDNSHTVCFDADVDSDGIYHIYASVKLRSSDNLIGVDDKGELYVSKEAVEAIVSGVSDDIIERVKTLEEKVEALEKEDISIKADIETMKDKVDKNTANIVTNTSNIADIKTQMATDETAFEALSEQVKTNADAISALQDEVKEVESEVKLDVEKLETIESEVGKAEEQIETNKTAIINLNTTVNQVQNDLTAETTRATNEEEKLQSQIDSLSAQVSSDEESILAEAKAYTDAETQRATATEEKLKEDVSTINDTMSSIKIEKASDNDLQYILYVGEADRGHINIPEDAFLKDVSYDSEHKAIVFDFLIKDDEGNVEEKTVTIYVSDMVSDYTSGNGISIDSNVVSIHINDDANTEGYLKIGDGGLFVSGVDSAISEAVTNASNELQAEIDENKGAIDILNGGVDTEGSVKNAIATAEGYTDKKVADLESQISEVASELCDAGDGLKKVDVEGGHKFEVHINENSQEYLTVGEDGLNLKGVASSDELNGVDERVKTIESDYATSEDIKDVQDGVDANASAIEKLSENFDDYKFHTVDTTTVELAMKEAESGDSNRELSAKAVISSQANNNILDNGGLYSISEFNYNAATNVMTFTNCNGVHEFTVNTDYSLVEGGYYDSANHAVVLIVKDSSGETHEISIPISDLIYDIDVDNDVNDPVKLKITTDATTGAKVISATLEIANLDTNLIVTNNGALYASNEARYIYCTSGEGTQKSVQTVISEYYNEINEINNTIASLEQGAEGTTSDITKLEEKVDANASDIASLKEELSEVKADVADLKQGLDDVKEELAELQKCLGDICANETSVADRLNNIESIIENLIDFGSYQEE